jgi:predicted porin
MVASSATPKNYVDAILGSATAASTSAASAATSATSAANSATLAATTTGNADLRGWQLGSTYDFSKRTTAYAIYGTQNVKGKDAAVGTKIESIGYTVGMRHSF